MSFLLWQGIAGVGTGRFDTVCLFVSCLFNNEIMMMIIFMIILILIIMIMIIILVHSDYF